MTGFSVFIRVGLAAFAVAAAAAQSASSNDALFAALRRGAVADVERLLAGGASPNALDADGTPALMTATLFGDARMLDLLLKRGADPNKSDASGATALMWAVSDIDKVRLLLARGADVTAKSKTGRTALLVAAAFPGTIDVVRLLLDRSADVRGEDGSGTTALAFAVRSSDVDVVRLLVERGLDPNALSPPARRSAFVRHDLPTTNYLMSKKLGPTPDVLMAASMWQPAPLVGRWIELGADVNQTAPPAQYARTALLTAVTSEGQGADALRILLERGADPNARSTEGESVLDWAIYKGDRAKIQLLERHGATRGDGPRRQAIPPPAAGVVSADARVALSRAVARVLEVAPKFREPTGCISCHHNALPALAAAVTRKKGIAINEQQARKNVDDIVAFFRAASPRMLLGDPPIGGEAITAGYVLMALAAEGHPADAVTASTTHWLLARQMTDGRWLGNGIDRPPSEYSTVSHTALAAGGLRAYELPGRREEIRESLRRAQRWLLAAPATSAEERGMRLMGLVWTDAPRSRIDEAIAEIRARQEPGGGWSQTGRTDADAYATGLSLYALHVAGVPATDDTCRKGRLFLLATQYPDGAWLVRTHAFPVQRYFESGFPFGRHQWISAAGTSWASLAIAQALP